MNIRIRDLGNVRARALDPTPDDLAILATDDYAGQSVTAEDVYIRQMLLCHDQYDRTYERFPKAYLQQFVRTLPGKSVLSCHDSGGYSGSSGLPLARFFRTSLTAKTEDFPVPVAGRRRMQRRGDEGDAELRVDDAGDVDPLDDTAGAGDTGSRSDDTDVIPNFEMQSKRVTYLKCGFYFANDASNDGLRKNIDLGVYKWVSIGFRYDDLDCDICQTSYLRSDCPHIMGWETEDGKLVTGTYSGDARKAEALEGSIVYLGAQPRARLIKQLQEGALDPKSCAQTPFGEDLILLKEAEALARQFGHQRKVWHMGVDLAKDAGGGSLTDLAFDDHSEAVLTAIEEYAGRAELLAERRLRDGRTINEARRAAWTQVRDRFNQLLQKSELPAGEGSTAPTVLKLQAELLKHQTDLQGLLIGVNQ